MLIIIIVIIVAFDVFVSLCSAKFVVYFVLTDFAVVVIVITVPC